MKPLFVTSLAPEPRRTVAGRDVGPAYQDACYRSIVRELGPCVSLNYESEAPALKARFPEADILPFPDQGGAAQSPLMRLADMRTALGTRNFTHIGIINADIYAPAQAARLLEPLMGVHDTALFACRTECTHLQSPAGPAYLHGFDLAVLPRDDFFAQNFHDFAVGVPWWDYALPLQRALSGQPLIIDVSSGLRHVSHPPSWSAPQWERGLLSLLDLLDETHDGGAADFAPDWRHLLRRELTAAGRGHQHRSLLHWGGALFGRLCRDRIFKAATIR